MKRHLIYFFVLQIMLFTSGCQSNDPTVIENDFGNSVRQMVSAQIYDQDAALFPDPEPPLSMDGMKASNSLESYREDTGNPESMDQPAIIQIDSNN